MTVSCSIALECIEVSFVFSVIRGNFQFLKSVIVEPKTSKFCLEHGVKKPGFLSVLL